MRPVCGMGFLLLALTVDLLGGCAENPVGVASCKVTNECPSQHVCVDGACRKQVCPDCADGEVCVAGQCLPAACGDRPCQAGEGCLEGRCVDEGCVAVSCPEGEACAKGQCLPVRCSEQDCEAGVCWNQRCVGRRCVGVICGANEVCVQGVCAPSGCVGVLCSTQAACVEGRCQEIACVGVVCPSGTLCARGRCLPVGCAGGACPEGQVCRDEVCVDSGCVEAGCPENHRCEASACVGCAEAELACADGEDDDCDGATDCADADCRQGPDCPCPVQPCQPGERCIGGRCLPEACGNHPCHDGQGCADEHCQAEPCQGVSCPPGLICAGPGLCFDEDCSTAECAVGDLCVGGLCVFGGCVGVICGSSETCADGRCLPIDCAASACAEGAVCVDEVCTPKGCVGISCPPGQRCARGLCLPEGCADGPACPGAGVCEGESCRDPSCDGLRCVDGMRCEASECVPCTAIEQDCADGKDNDCNRMTDCLDPACAATETCRCRALEHESLCADGVDDDCDGWIDCVDPECDGQVCSDHDACTTEDRCRGLRCEGLPVRCESPPNSLCYEARGSCNSKGECEYAKKDAGESCSDGNVCLVGQTCNADGLCLGATQRDCGDEDPCTADRCDLATGCLNTPVLEWTSCGLGKVCQSGACVDSTVFCEIAGTVYWAGQSNPANPCERCHPPLSSTTWSAQPDGMVCQAGRVCDARACSSGCYIAGAYHADGAANPGNPCQVCKPTSSTEAWSSATNGLSCGSGKVCDAGVCSTGCLIGGTYYVNGAANPTNVCQQCTSGSSTTAWSNKTDGTACGAGQICHAGSCASGCLIGGTYYANGTVNPGKSCQQCTSASSTSNWTTRAVGTACGTGQVCNGTTCSAGCAIAGVFYASAATNPANACQQCTPGTSTTAWTNKGEGLSCGTGQICRAGACSAGCQIGGTPYADGTVNSANACQQCVAATSTTAWTTRAAGTSCGTGQVCSGTTCSAGCFIGGTVRASGAVNPSNACQQCTPGTSTTAWSNKAEGLSCGTGQICRAGACSAGCLIGGTYYANGTANPSKACQQCTSASSTTAWSSKADGTACGAGQICSAGACASGCLIGGTYYASGAANPANDCQQCTPGTSTTTWSDKGDGVSCGTGQVCRAGACSTGCLIGGTYYANGAINPANVCQQCTSVSSTTGWSNRASGTSCGTGQICNAGACAAGCLIGGTYYASGAANPANGCQRCTPGTSTTAWSNKGDGVSCGAGQICRAGACSTGCLIGGTYHANGAVNPTNVCEQCTSASSTTGWSNKANGTSCGAGQICHAGACASGCLIGGTYHPSGATNPGNVCQQCTPAASTAAWSDSANGTSCGSGQACTAGVCAAAGCLIGGVQYAAGDSDPGNACQRCTPATSTTAWSVASNGTSCGNGTICNGGSCSMGCYISGAYYAIGTTSPSEPCKMCQSFISTSAWTAKSTGASCGNGLICTGTGCGAACWIDGVVRPSGATNQYNNCQVCQPALSTSDWSNRNGSCSSGKVCKDFACVDGCWIGGAFYNSGALNPSRPCQRCAPATSTVDWTNVSC